jgi:hypothetical protein
VAKKVILFTDSVGFGYDVISSLEAQGLLDEVYVQRSPVQSRLRRYLKDAMRLRGIRRRVIGLVDRVNRPSRTMSVDVGDDILETVGATPFINFSELRSKISTSGAIVIVYGTRLVPSWVYKDAAQTINVHWGLSPYYRGILCTDWAVLNKDVNNIGFTLHELTNKVDGGRIITQRRIIPQVGDTVGSITTRIHFMAKEALLKAVSAAQEHQLSTVPQDLSIGRNYTSRDWTVWTSLRLKRLTPVDQSAIDHSPPEYPIHENPAFNSSV